MDTEILKELLITMQYDKAEEELLKLPHNERLEEVVFAIFDIADLSLLNFVDYLEEKGWSKPDIYTMKLKIFMHLPYLDEDAYSKSLSYARKLFEIEPTIENLELILYYNVIPERLVSDKEALEICEEILKVDKTNEAALSTIRDIDYYRNR